MKTDPNGKPTLETERLLLNSFQMNDCAFVAALAADKRIYDKTLLIPHPYEPRHAEEWIGTHAAQWARWREDWSFNFAIRAKSGEKSGEVMGAIGLVGRAAHKRAEMGYWLGAAFWGHGFMTEAARAVVDLAHGELGINRLEAGVFEGNAASMNVLRKVGFREEGVLRQRFWKNGRFVDERMWASVRAGGTAAHAHPA